MKIPLGFGRTLGIGALIVACGFLFWIDAVRGRRVEYVTKLVGTAVVPNGASPTGYAGGLRQLIVPEHNYESYQWIAQTQQMLSRDEWRIRHVGYDNAPVGREVRTPSPYRWWLGLLAWIDHELSGRSLGMSVERVALIADPLLHFLLLVGATVFTAWQFGAYAAVLLCFGVVVLFPFGGAFLPGQPNDGGLAQACALWSVLLLLAAFRPPRNSKGAPGNGGLSRSKMDRCFFLAGLVGGFCLWANVARALPILMGIALGGLTVSFLSRRDGKGEGFRGIGFLPWRLWALGGAMASLVAYGIEYFPADAAGFRLEENHPLYAIAWLGAGELIERLEPGIRGESRPWNRRTLVLAALALLALAAVPVTLAITGGGGPMVSETQAQRLTNLSDSPIAANSWTWVRRDGFSGDIAATCLPLLLLGPAVWLVARKSDAPAERAAIAIALGPVMLALGYAIFRLSWWAMLDGALLALVVAIATAIRPGSGSLLGRWLCTGTIVVTLCPGLAQYLGRARGDAKQAVTKSEVQALVERDLSHWLANQTESGSAVALAPPDLTTSIIYFGGLAGLGTPDWENKAGFLAAVRLAGASSADEAYALANSRGLSYIVIPSWDHFLDEYARLGANQVDHSLMALLHHWLPPRWLRPIPYHLPIVSGFEGQDVVIFKVVDLQDNATALSRLAEYFLEMGQADQAIAASRALKRLYPRHLGAVIARCRVERADGDPEELEAATSDLTALLSRGEDKGLPWDRRVSLAVALAEDKRFELSREQLKLCLSDISEPHLRSLTTDSLYRVQQMSRAFRLPIADQRLRELVSILLPGGLQKSP